MKVTVLASSILILNSVRFNQQNRREMMDREIKELKQELDNTRQVLGTLISWLGMELGEHNAVKLLDMLSQKEDKQ